MTRITKDPEERKNEIIDAAEELFNTKGFEQTSVSDIVKRVGVAQGLFYYYFKSKEEILNAVLDRYISFIIQNSTRIVENDGLNAQQKLQLIIDGIFMLGKGKRNLTEYVHREKNSPIHQLLTKKTVEHLTPLIAGIISQGVNDGVFDTQYPEEVVGILIPGFNDFLHDIVFTEDTNIKRKWKLPQMYWKEPWVQPRGASTSAKLTGGDCYA